MRPVRLPCALDLFCGLACLGLSALISCVVYECHSTLPDLLAYACFTHTLTR